jgi:hypothetical protein
LKLEKFLKVYRTWPRLFNPWKHVKVAVIDTGVDLSDKKLAISVEEGKGKSFVYTKTERNQHRESPWYLASEAHGTQMASLILDIDPLCHLYIAKVGTDRKSIIKEENIEDVSLI